MLEPGFRRYRSETPTPWKWKDIVLAPIYVIFTVIFAMVFLAVFRGVGWLLDKIVHLILWPIQWAGSLVGEKVSQHVTLTFCTGFVIVAAVALFALKVRHPKKYAMTEVMFALVSITYPFWTYEARYGPLWRELVGRIRSSKLTISSNGSAALTC